MSDQHDDVVDKEARMREEERKIREHESSERPPGQRSGETDEPAPPGEAGRGQLSGS